mmetsp:Transcript_104123/g.333900  ORF Transcript_104123/g.333900 Transcript_104123/m.333900 type:complete len:380 (+) Transcript_104123:119-1258(+)
MEGNGAGGGANGPPKIRRLVHAGRRIAASPRHVPPMRRGGTGAQAASALPSACSAAADASERSHGGGLSSQRSMVKSPGDSDDESSDPRGLREGLASGEDSSSRGVGYSAGDGSSVDAAAIAKGGAELFKRLHDVGGNNVELRKQLELQAKEISTLEDSGRAQQRLLQDFERHAEKTRQGEALAAEAKVRAEAAEREDKLRAEMEEMRERFQREKDAVVEQMKDIEVQRGIRAGERDEARAQVRDLEGRLEAAHGAPENAQARVRALEMEVALVRSRFAKEQVAREAAQREAREAREQKERVQGQLDRANSEARQLTRQVAEQQELGAFRQEVSNDLQAKLKLERAQADKRLIRERGKFEAVARLEGILPRGLILQALA